ncbi:AsmA-like C-terminal region-containing protein [Foetidibacter luteolus]|uniref:AsmA-like C-terminal region-containing protein n=1 Tax=Foetidibacter luteolus TaxID=2608880 RepID=UPI00129BE79B|nr:AsmA-like C-terminal region-containing protein [Foetidibacter luteolus]
MVNRKVLKRAGIITASILGLYLLILTAASIYINGQKSKILSLINNALKENLQGKAEIKDIDVSVWRRFPKIEVRLLQVSLADSLYNKPLLSAESISTTIGVFNVLGKHKTVNDIRVKNGVFHLFTDSSGYSNNYLFKLKKKPDTRPTNEKEGGTVEISDIRIENLLLTIEDQPAGKKHEMLVNNLEAELDTKDSVIAIKMNEKITMKTGLGFKLSKGSYLENQVLEADWDLSMNTSAKHLTINKTSLKINKHPYDISGYFDFSANPGFKVEVHTKDVLYANALHIVTAAIRQKIGLVQLDKPLNVDGVIEGSLLPNREPFVNVSWNTKNNNVQTPVISFTKSSFSGNFMNEVNKDSARNDANSRVVIYDLDGDWEGIRLNGKNIMITNLENSHIQFVLNSQCSFEALDNKLALDNIRFVKGTTDISLRYNGPLTKDKSMLENVEGVFHVKDGVIEYVPRNFTFTNCNGTIGFFQDSISVDKFTCDYGSNHFEALVTGKNVRRKFVAGDVSEAALINCTLFSPMINLNDFNALFGQEKKLARRKPKARFSKTAGSIDEMLTNGTIRINIKANEIKHSNLTARNFVSTISFRPHFWEIENVAVNLADGSLNARGSIRKINANYHEASLNAHMQNMNVQKLFYAFNNFGLKDLTGKNLRGNFSTTTQIRTGINSQGKLVPSGMKGVVDFSLKNGALVNFAPLANIKNFVLSNKDLTNIRFAELKDKLEINGSEVYINRMEIQSTALTMFVEGAYDLDGKDTELLLQVPFSNLEERDKTYKPKNQGVNAKVGPSVLLRAVSGDDGKVKIKLTLSKKVRGKKMGTK